MVLRWEFMRTRSGDGWVAHGEHWMVGWVAEAQGGWRASLVGHRGAAGPYPTADAAKAAVERDAGQAISPNRQAAMDHQPYWHPTQPP